MSTLSDIKTAYCRAFRCWKSNNLSACLQLCNQLTSEIRANLKELDQATWSQLVWTLRIKCFAEECYLNEALLLNEEDIEGEEQVSTFTSNKTNQRQSAVSRVNASSGANAIDRLGGGGGLMSGRKVGTGTVGLAEQRHTSGMITGRVPSVSSRRTSGAARASSSYRPLTTSLTASQTAFSRSTQPLLKFANNQMWAKFVFEYLYNVQKVTNKCPDYRQCLEFLNIVQQNSRQARQSSSTSANAKEDHSRQEHQWANKQDQQWIIAVEEETNSDSQLDKHLECFWLMAFGVCYFNLRMYKLAIDYFLVAKQANPKQLDPYLWLVKIHLRLSEPIRVLKICEEGLKNCKNSIMFNWKARVQSLLLDSNAAHLSLSESLRHFPTNIEALANVGHYYFYGDKVEQALKCFERIQQLSMNSSMGLGSGGLKSDHLLNSTCELFNNLALCNYYAGNLIKVVPYFQQAFLSSPNKETTSDIWFNLSFVPLALGYQNLAIECLNLALASDSQNEEAINNLGVLKYGTRINDPLHYKNKQELWASKQTNNNWDQSDVAIENVDTQQYRRQQMMFNEAESYFSTPIGGGLLVDTSEEESNEQDQVAPYAQHPEMLFNMALVKYQRGQLLVSAKYCQQYLQYDQNNYMVLKLMRDIKRLVCHDG